MGQSTGTYVVLGVWALVLIVAPCVYAWWSER